MISEKRNNYNQLAYWLDNITERRKDTRNVKALKEVIRNRKEPKIESFVIINWKEVLNMENEPLAAEILLHSVDTSEATAEIDEELSKVEESLKAYTCTASMFDYSTAVISGILAGAIDAFLIKDTISFDKNQKPIKEQLSDAIGIIIQRIVSKDRIEKPVFHRAVEQGIPAMLPMLEKYAIQPTPMGLGAAILIQMGRGGMLRLNENRIQFLPDSFSKCDGVLLVIIAAFVGILKWLSAISVQESNQDHSDIRFKTLGRIRELIRTAPIFHIVVNDIEKWQKQLPNEMKCGSKSNDGIPGIEKVFCSFFIMMGNVPAFQNTNLEKAVNLVVKGNRLGLNEIPIINSLSRQAFPVLINEVIVRTIFFASRLIKELQYKNNTSDINWNNILPFGNRDIERLIFLSSMTLSAADIADAALHAAIDSRGEMVLFATKYITRFNFVAAGRLAVAVIKERNNEKVEEELIRMKRLLTEAKTAKALEILQAYQEQLDIRVSEYLARDIETFLEGLDCIDQGIARKDSDQVIRGNVIIQRVLGREQQFTNQQEFNDLMGSDIALRL